MKIELPKRIKGKSFLSEVHEITVRQCFPIKNLQYQKPKNKILAFLGLEMGRREKHTLFFLPLFIVAFMFMIVYVAILRLLKK